MKRIVTILFVCAVMIGVLAPVSFSLLPQNNFATALVAHAADASSSDVMSNIGSCGIYFGNMGNCLAYFFYFQPFWVGGLVLKLAALFLDSTASLTLSSSIFTNVTFLGTGWALMRDISNLFFIFILLYIALCIILDIKVKGVDQSDPKRLIWWVILMALLINFSMFVTDFVIDTSNTLALVFYNQITVKDVNGQDTSTSAGNQSETAATQGIVGTKATIIPTKQIGSDLASSFDANEFAKASFWDKLKSGQKEVPAGTMITFLCVMGALYYIVAWSFFVAGLSFLGRMVELFVLVIFSPIAFVSYIVPSMKKMEWFGWDDWWKRLLDTSFAAPIYFLFILLIALILKDGLFGGNGSAANNINNTTWASVVVTQILIPAVFLVIMLIKATHFAKKASGTIGNAVGSAGSALLKGGAMAMTGGMAGSAMGGMAALGRNTIGKSGEKKLEQKGEMWRQQAAAGGFTGWAARQKLKMADSATKSSFDVRHTAAGQSLSKTTGMSFASVGALSSTASAGGRVNAKQRELANLAKKKEMLGYNKTHKKEADAAVEKNKKDLEHKKEALEDKQYNINKNKDALKEADKDTKIPKKEVTEAQSQVWKAEEAREKTDPNNAPAIAAADAVVAAAKQNLQLKEANLKAVEANHPALEIRKEYEKVREEVKILEHGTPAIKVEEKDANGHTVRDPNTGKPNMVVLKDEFGNTVREPHPTIQEGKPWPPGTEKAGEIVTKNEAELAKLGGHDLKEAGHNIENARFKEYVANKEKKAYGSDPKNVTVKKDTLGNITQIKSDGKAEMRTLPQKLKEAMQSALGTWGVGTGTALGLGGAGLAASAVGLATLGTVISVAAPVVAMGGVALAITNGFKQLKKTGTNQDVNHSARMDAMKTLSTPGKDIKPNLAKGGGYEDFGTQATNALKEAFKEMKVSVKVSHGTGGGGHGEAHGDHGGGDHGGGDHGGGDHGHGGGHGH